MLSRPWNNVSPSKWTTPYFLALCSNPTTLRRHLEMLERFQYLRNNTYVSWYLAVDLKKIFEEDAGNVVFSVNVVSPGGMIPHCLTHLNNLNQSKLGINTFDQSKNHFSTRYLFQYQSDHFQHLPIGTQPTSTQMSWWALWPRAAVRVPSWSSELWKREKWKQFEDVVDILQLEFFWC